MKLRLIKPLQGHRGVEVINHPVTQATITDKIGYALAKNPQHIVDLVDNSGKVLKRYTN